MDIAKIGWGLGTLAAVVLTFVNTGHDGTILAVLGLIAGYASATDHRRGVMIAAIFLMAGGSGALGGLIAVGEHLTNILGSLSSVFSAAAVAIIVKTMIERFSGSEA